MKLHSAQDEQSSRPLLGMVEWFRPGEHERVELVLSKLKALGISELRTAVSWADWHTPYGESWYHWLLPRLAKDVHLLPCFLYTPPSLGVAPRASAPPREPRAYADFLDQVITDFDDCFDMVELWNEPNNLSEYDWTLDPQWHIFCEMIGSAAYWAQQRGKGTVLGGMAPADPNWLSTIGCGGVLNYIDVVGIHGFPGVWEFAWQGWDYYLEETREVLRQHDCGADIWITETGFSTWRHGYHNQLRAFLEALDAPVERVYWYAVQDLQPEYATVDGFHSDERDYHFGLTHCDGSDKLICRVLQQEGQAGLRRLADLAHAATPPVPVRKCEASSCPKAQAKAVPATLHKVGPAQSSASGRVLITGGAGFIGTNLAHRLLREGREVAIYDSLARRGAESNLRWLSDTYGDRLQLHLADVRDPIALGQALSGVEQVFHLAAQVAVTTSLVKPAVDFEINGLGTMNLLEEMRRLDNPPRLVFTSTNKVYGGLADIGLRLSGQRYEPADPALRHSGISEARPLDFHSPYGCSKGTADQYVVDYARSYGLETVVFRMSCIYGPHQRGSEDQGWVAHFVLRALKDEPITLFGDGCQVRDVLFVEDLVEAFLLAEANLPELAGEVFNIGGGPQNTISLLELIDLIEEMQGARPLLHHDQWRIGDQRYYVSDTRKFQRATGWQPEVGVHEGVQRLHEWLVSVHGSARLSVSAKARRLPEPVAAAVAALT
ncbi:MAG: NAD-dependent epimerase/dehydratase family protein [Armatimonadia bacterium]